MNIDFIKWLCDKAEDFMVDKEWGKGVKEYENKALVICPNGDYWRTDWEDEDQDIYYPLLLQRAIEGVNRDDTTPYLIMQNHRGVYYNTYDDPSEFDGSTEDQAKESALKYIWEQEQKQ